MATYICSQLVTNNIKMYGKRKGSATVRRKTD